MNRPTAAMLEVDGRYPAQHSLRLKVALVKNRLFIGSPIQI